MYALESQIKQHFQVTIGFSFSTKFDMDHQSLLINSLCTMLDCNDLRFKFTIDALTEIRTKTNSSTVENQVSERMKKSLCQIDVLVTKSFFVEQSFIYSVH